MLDLDLTRFQERVQIKIEDDKRFVFDPIRKKWLTLQPEEWVRQLFLQYLLLEKNYNANRIRIEMGIKINGLQRRCDVLVFDAQMNPFLLVECKAPSEAVNGEVFHQLAMYNLPLQVTYLLMTNGLDTLVCAVNPNKQAYDILSEVPDWPGY
jgi:virulence-associated protein VagC